MSHSGSVFRLQNAIHRTRSQLAFDIIPFLQTSLLAVAGTMTAPGWSPPFHALVYVCWLVAVVEGDLDLTVLHTNDVHARVEQTDKYSANCSQADAEADRCYGGVARRYAAVHEIRRRHDNVLLLDAGDEFQGTIWFSYYDGLEASHFMNLLGYDAMALGNHEFDNGVDGLLSPFLENASFPILSCNINFSSYPEIQKRVHPYIIVNLTDGAVGIIGYTTPETKILADPMGLQNVTFNDILPCVRQSVKELEDQGINKILALGHSGYSFSQEVALIPGVDMVIDGHSHTFLYNGEAPSSEPISGPYPTEVAQPDGGLALVYQAYAYGKYLGMAQVSFDEEGKVSKWPGNPLLLNSSWQQDPAILKEVEKWREPLEGYAKSPIGESYVLLQGGKPYSRTAECNLGNLVTDAIWYKHIRAPTDSGWSSVRIVFWNGGAIRISLTQGPINAGKLLEILPFRNTVEQIWITGSVLRKILEHSVTDIDPSNPPGRFLQISGMKVVYDLSQPEGSRLADVLVTCTDCQFPNYRPLDDDELYPVLTNSYLINGGDGYSMLGDNVVKRWPIGTAPVDALEHYIKKMTPVYPGVEGRITFLNKSQESVTDKSECGISISGSKSTRRYDVTNLTLALHLMLLVLNKF